MARFLHENDNFFRRRFLLLENCLTRQKISTTVLAIPFPLWIVQLNEKNASKAIPSHFFSSNLTLHEEAKISLVISQRQTVSMRNAHS